MASKVIYGAFIILILIAYIGFINTLNFGMDYKLILYLPAIFFFLIFMFLGFKSGDNEAEIGGFPYEY